MTIVPNVPAPPVVHANPVAILVTSYGREHTPTRSADAHLDVGHLINPARFPQFCNLTGLYPAVAEYVLQQQGFERLLNLFVHMVLDRHEGHTSLATLQVTVRSPWGRYRAPAVAEEVGRRLRLALPDLFVAVAHLNVPSDVPHPLDVIDAALVDDLSTDLEVTR